MFTFFIYVIYIRYIYIIFISRKCSIKTRMYTSKLLLIKRVVDLYENSQLYEKNKIVDEKKPII